MAIFAAFLASACGGTADDPSSTSSTDEELKAKAPIPYVLQWAGEYAGDGSGGVDWVVLRKTGTFAARINGKVETGRFMGPGKPGQWPLVIAFVSNGDSFKGTISQWSDASGHAVMTIAHHGASEVVTAAWTSTSEAACDATGGSWTDDDVDPTTGLYCVCPSSKSSWLPSHGGCVR